MSHFSRQRLLFYTVTATATAALSFHLHRHFSTQEKETESSSTATLSPARLRNIWVSGLVEPSNVRVTERRLLYTGQIEKMEDARKQIEMKENEYASFVKQQHSWLNSKKEDNFTVFKWLTNPISDSIPADLTFFTWRKHYKMTVIDTPDHVDFTPEVQNALRAFDGAVQVLSSVDGVQDQFIAVDKQMITHQLPRLIFIHNLDQKGANPWEVVNQARSKLQHHTAAVQVPIGLDYNFKGLVDLVHLKAYYFHGPNGKKVVVEEVPADMEALVSEKRHELIKTVSKVDGKLAEAFSSGTPISAADLEAAVCRATIARKFIPLFMGSAFKYKGLQLLFDGVLDYLPCPTEASNSAVIQYKNGEKNTLVALAFTLNRKYDQITYLRIYEGVIRVGDFITNGDTGKTFKVPHFFEAVRKDRMGVSHLIEVRKDEAEVPYSTELRKDALGVPNLVWVRNDEAFQEAHAGEIVAVHDVTSAPGDTFTDGLVTYTKAPIDVSELVARDS